MAGCNGLGEGHGVEVNGAHFFLESIFLPPFKDSSDFLEMCLLSSLAFGSMAKSGFFLFTSFPEGNSRRSVVVTNEERKGKSPTVVHRKKYL